jgi:hypothetical protein
MLREHPYITLDVLAMRDDGAGTEASPLRRTVLAEYHESAVDWDAAAERALFLARFAACEPGATLVSVSHSYGHEGTPEGSPLHYGGTVVYSADRIVAVTGVGTNRFSTTRYLLDASRENG